MNVVSDVSCEIASELFLEEMVSLGFFSRFFVERFIGLIDRFANDHSGDRFVIVWFVCFGDDRWEHSVGWVYHIWCHFG